MNDAEKANWHRENVMSEARQQLVREWNGLISNAIAECLRLRRDKVRLYEMLIQSGRYVTVNNQYGFKRYKRWWTE